MILSRMIGQSEAETSHSHTYVIHAFKIRQHATFKACYQTGQLILQIPSRTTACSDTQLFRIEVSSKLQHIIYNTKMIATVLLVILTIFLPPVGVYCVAGCGADLLINILLTVLG